MNFEINVARLTGAGNYEHLFATHERSIRNQRELALVLPLILAAFPEPAFHISVTRQECHGQELTVEELRAMGVRS